MELEGVSEGGRDKAAQAMEMVPGVQITMVGDTDAVALVDQLVRAIDRVGASIGLGTARSEFYLREARSNLLLAVNSVQASVDYKCTLDTPPEDIRGRPEGANGAMIHKCFHPSNHCWDGTWQPMTCP